MAVVSAWWKSVNFSLWQSTVAHEEVECKVVSGETCEGRGSSKARPGTRAQPGGMLTRLEIAGASRSRAVKGGRPSIFAMEKNQRGEVETRHRRVTKILI